jgi:carboxylesterase type B
MLKTLPLPVTEVAYQSIMTEFGLENAPVKERIKRLIGMEPEELVSRTPMTVPLLPYLDGDIVPEPTTFECLANSNGAAGQNWCEELMIGDCQHDGNVFLFMGLAQRKAGIANSFRTSLHVNLPEAAAAAVLAEYNLHTTTDDHEAIKLIIDLATYIAYFAPALAYARSFPGKTYYYHFNEPNPWDGPFKGCSTHMLDAAFLFQNVSEQMPPEARRVAEVLAQDFVKFANGVKPWDCFEAGGGDVQTYGPSDKRVVGMIENNGLGHGRRDILSRLGEEGKVDLDQLSVAWDLFIAGK